MDNHRGKSLATHRVGAVALGIWNYYRNYYSYNKRDYLLLYVSVYNPGMVAPVTEEAGSLGGTVVQTVSYN